MKIVRVTNHRRNGSPAKGYGAGVAFTAFLAILGLAFSANAQRTSADKRGKFIGDNVYNNPALGMTITLPGPWKFSDQETRENPGQQEGRKAPPNPDCRGPFCSGIDVDVALLSKEAASRGAIFLIAYKLSPEYLDRGRYPLKRFAEAMTTDSLAGSNWIVANQLTPIELDGKPAYRLLVHAPSPTATIKGESKGFGYVAESNGYVFYASGFQKKAKVKEVYSHAS